MSESIKVVVLCGGFGTRLSEETDIKPKPMVEVGGRPILWHIMKIYSSYGFNDYIICLGYKGYVVKEYFSNYFLHQSDVTIDLRENRIDVHDSKAEKWRVTLVDTGLNTMTGGRVKRIMNYIGKETFMLTYGDAVADIDIKKLVEFHKSHGKLATITAVQPSGRFGALDLDSNGSVLEFKEKPKGDGSWINGGFFVLETKIFDYIQGDETYWEREPLENLAKDGELVAFEHKGFWQPMDTLRDKNQLDKLWGSGKPPWKKWD